MARIRSPTLAAKVISIPGARFSGPALIVEDQTTTFAPSAFDGIVSPEGHLVLTRRSQA